MMNTISAGNGFTVAITNYGRITAWGWDGHEEVSGHKQITLDEDEVYVAVSSGSHHTMALTSLGRIIGWGSNYWGQVSGIKPNSITHAINTHKYVAVSAGVSRTSAITTKGKIVEWGSSHISDIKLEDIKLNENESYILVSTGIYHTMALTSEGRIVGWGSNSFDKITGHNNISLNDGEKYIDVNASNNLFTIALTSEGRIFGWGEKEYVGFIKYLKFDPSEPYVAISIKYYHLMALTSKGRIVGWGDDKYGQVSGVKKLSPGVKYIEVSAGHDHTIAKTNEGKIVGWGDDRHGAVSGWESIELGPGENYKTSSIDMAVVHKKIKARPVMHEIGSQIVGHPSRGIYGMKEMIEDPEFGDYHEWRDWCKELDEQFKIHELKIIGEWLKINGYDTMTKKELCKNIIGIMGIETTKE